MTATLILIVGLPGSGKTTLSRQLETERDALRLTPDEWMHALFGQGESGDLRWVLESQLLWNVAARVLTLGRNVILDYGCWSRTERQLFRDHARRLGVNFELHALDVPTDLLWTRLEARNAALPADTFPISRHELDTWAVSFEPVNETEAQSIPGELVIIHRQA